MNILISELFSGYTIVNYFAFRFWIKNIFNFSVSWTWDTVDFHWKTNRISIFSPGILKFLTWMSQFNLWTSFLSCWLWICATIIVEGVNIWQDQRLSSRRVHREIRFLNHGDDKEIIQSFIFTFQRINMCLEESGNTIDFLNSRQFPKFE